MAVFVIWEPVTGGVRALLEALPEVELGSGAPPPVWDIPFLGQGGRGVGRDMLRRGLLQAEHVIALLDKPSASVGWQVGLAFGWGRSMQLAYFDQAVPKWTQSGPLAGLSMRPLRDLPEVDALLTPQRWELSPAADTLGESTVLLCPTGPTSSTLRTVAKELLPELVVLEASTCRLNDLPSLLAAAKRVVWVVAPDESEGGQNAANAVIAGFAEAKGRHVAVLRSTDCPAIPDVRSRELCFSGVEEFKEKLTRTCASAPAESMAVPLELRRSRAPIRRQGRPSRRELWTLVLLLAGALLGGLLVLALLGLRASTAPERRALPPASPALP